MQSFLNSKLFLHSTVDTVSDFQPWMLLQQQQQQQQPQTRLESAPPPPLESRVAATLQQQQQKEYRPRCNKHNDALFECVYFLHYGHPIPDKNVETQEKLTIVKWASENRTQLLPLVSATKLQQYTSEIMSVKQTTWGSLFLMCQFYNMNIRVEAEGRHMYMDFVAAAATPTDSDHRIIMRRDQYAFWIPSTADSSNNIAVDFQQKTPLKAQSNYKIEELQQLARKLGIDTSSMVAPNNKKKDWYEAVYRALAW